jgi:hypothetical protein
MSTLHNEFLVFNREFDRRAVGDFAAHQRTGELRLNVALEEAF